MLDTDHRKNNDGRGFRIGIDISATAPAARFVGKPNNFAHCNPLAAAAYSLVRAGRVGAFLQLNGLQG